MFGTLTGSSPSITFHPADLLQNLIRFNTTNPPGNEMECIRYIANLLEEAGITPLLLARDPRRPNLVARLPGRGNAPPLLLYGHVDVVPAADQVWQYPPFEGRLADGQIWGRGALDMKGGVAMMLAAFLTAKLRQLSLPGDVIFAALSDEEMLGDYGSKYLVKSHAHLFRNVRYAIGEFGASTFYIGEQKFYPIMVSEKQICGILAHIHGPTGHTTIPVRGGAMGRLGQILVRLDRRNLPVHITPVTRNMLQTMAAVLPFPSNLMMNQLLNPRLTDRVLGMLGSKGQVLDPILRHTVNPMLVKGGEHIGQVPKEVLLHLACILLPGFETYDILDELRPIVGQGVDMEVTHYEPVPPVPDMGLFPLLSGILKEADPSGIAVPLLLPAPTDGHNFAQLGIQTYGFLPMNLQPDFDFWQLLHASDERIPVEALEFGTAAIYKLLQRFGKN
jgi:acetylornithine deacetylase/succinyl-diaminopimelate desuccinylase-like protein